MVWEAGLVVHTFKPKFWIWGQLGYVEKFWEENRCREINEEGKILKLLWEAFSGNTTGACVRLWPIQSYTLGTTWKSCSHLKWIDKNGRGKDREWTRNPETAGIWKWFSFCCYSRGSSEPWLARAQQPLDCKVMHIHWLSQSLFSQSLLFLLRKFEKCNLFSVTRVFYLYPIVNTDDPWDFFSSPAQFGILFSYHMKPSINCTSKLHTALLQTSGI